MFGGGFGVPMGSGGGIKGWCGGFGGGGSVLGGGLGVILGSPPPKDAASAPLRTQVDLGCNFYVNAEV